jgi:tRNA A37 threonylcarbamoyladenosine biosynthesis protein TsaE
VEWPDKAAGLLPEDTLHVWVTTETELTRKISLINGKF